MGLLQVREMGKLNRSSDRRSANPSPVPGLRASGSREAGSRKSFTRSYAEDAEIRGEDRPKLDESDPRGAEDRAGRGRTFRGTDDFVGRCRWAYARPADESEQSFLRTVWWVSPTRVVGLHRMDGLLASGPPEGGTPTRSLALREWEYRLQPEFGATVPSIVAETHHYKNVIDRLRSGDFRGPVPRWRSGTTVSGGRAAFPDPHRGPRGGSRGGSG